MSNLSKVLVFKIAATVIVWCIPLIFFPDSLLVTIGLPEQHISMFLRLLGMAYLALCVGYSFGLKETLEGGRPLGVIWVGVVSNVGACALFTWFGLNGAWSSWGGFVQFIMWLSLVATAGIAIGLVVTGLLADSIIRMQDSLKAAI